MPTTRKKTICASKWTSCGARRTNGSRFSSGYWTTFLPFIRPRPVPARAISSSSWAGFRTPVATSRVASGWSRLSRYLAKLSIPKSINLPRATARRRPRRESRTPSRRVTVFKGNWSALPWSSCKETNLRINRPPRPLRAIGPGSGSNPRRPWKVNPSRNLKRRQQRANRRRSCQQNPGRPRPTPLGPLRILSPKARRIPSGRKFNSECGARRCKLYSIPRFGEYVRSTQGYSFPEPEKMQPRFGYGPAINSAQRQAVEFQLRFVEFHFLTQLLPGRLVCLEVRHPDFLGQDDCEIHKALHHEEFAAQFRRVIQQVQLRQLLGRKPRGERDFAMHVRPLGENLSAGVRAPKVRQRREVQGGDLFPGQHAFAAQPFRFRLQFTHAAEPIQRRHLEKRVVRCAEVGGREFARRGVGLRPNLKPEI